MGKYLSEVNRIVADEVNRLDYAIVYGENLDRGSFLSGLSRNLRPAATRRIVNVGNCEYTHCGLGFGAMLGGVHAVLFVKQLDFMLLGVDHFVSTYHSIRAYPPEKMGSFTIVVAVYDQGYQGPQSSFNSIADICSMARVSGFTLTNLKDAEAVVSSEIPAPGFRIIGLSQRCAGDEIYEPEELEAAEDLSVFQYSRGRHATVVCANFSLPYGLEVQRKFSERGLSVSLFSVNPVYGAEWSLILSDAARTKRVLVLDDTKGVSGLGHRIVAAVSGNDVGARVRLVNRAQEIEFGVAPETFEFSIEECMRALGLE